MSKKKQKPAPWTKQCQVEVTGVKEVEEFGEGWKPGTKLLIRRESVYYQRPCGSFMPDDYDRCDSCLLEAYSDQLGLGRYDSGGCCVMGPRMFDEENVIAALRKQSKQREELMERSLQLWQFAEMARSQWDIWADVANKLMDRQRKDGHS